MRAFAFVNVGVNLSYFVTRQFKGSSDKLARARRLNLENFFIIWSQAPTHRLGGKNPPPHTHTLETSNLVHPLQVPPTRQTWLVHTCHCYFFLLLFFTWRQPSDAFHHFNLSHVDQTNKTENVLSNKRLLHKSGRGAEEEITQGHHNSAVSRRRQA